MEVDGYIGAIKMVVAHKEDFDINLTSEAFLSNFNTKDKITSIIVVAPQNDVLFDYKGTFEIIDVQAANSHSFVNVVLPLKTSLDNAYPNPFNPSTNIRYKLAINQDVKVSIYNIAGQHIETLVDNFQNAGNYELNWDASMYPSGMYILYLNTSLDIFSQKIMLIK